MMDIYEFINVHWLTVVLSGLYTHLRQICIIGICLDDENGLPFDHTYPSIIFVISVLCLLAEYRLWPRSLKEPPIHLLFVYEILVAALVTNLTMSLIWTPLMHSILCLTSEATKLVYWLHSLPYLNKLTFLKTLAYYLDTDLAASHSAMCLSVLSFIWMLDATESLDGIYDLLIKQDTFDDNTRNERISFTRPEVTDYFWYTACKNWCHNLSTKLYNTSVHFFVK